MSRALVASVLLVVMCCAAAAAAAPAKPVRNVLVYSKPTSPLASTDTEHVWRARLDGSHPQPVGGGEDPAVSPDGRWIAFGRARKILLVSTNGGTPRVVYRLHRGQPALPSAPVWAPNSRVFGVSDTVGLAIVDPGRRAARIIPSVETFAFSPDSRKVAYEARGDLYVIAADGGKARRLTDDRKSYAPVWGKTGIAFVRFTGGAGAHGDVWLSDGRRGHARQLTHTGAAFWPAFFSADGTKLLAANPATHDGRLWAVDVTTGDARPLTPWFGDLVPQGLSADGKTVLASVGCGGVPGSAGYVETIPFAGGKPHVIVRGPCRASWNAR